ncbi:serine protease filzig-like [Cotesia glomerata]|nr:serine protease filzig-like [Cotesia glomerata]
MKFLVLSVACLVASVVSLPSANRPRRDILPGDSRYGTDYHHHHHHEHHDNTNVQVDKTVGNYAGTVNSPAQGYGPPGFQPGNTVEPAPTFELPTIQVNSFKPEIPSTNYGVPVPPQNDVSSHYFYYYNKYQNQQQHQQQYQQQQQHQQHYQQPHHDVEQQQQEIRYTPAKSYGPPAVRAAPEPVKTPVTSYGTPVQNKPVEIDQNRAPQPQDYSVQIFRSQPVKINYQPQHVKTPTQSHPVHSHPQSGNNGYHYQPAQPTAQPAQTAPVSTPNNNNNNNNNGYHYHPPPTAQPAPQPTNPNQGYNYPQPALAPVPVARPALTPVTRPAHPTNTNNGNHYHPAPSAPSQPALVPVAKPGNTYLNPIEKKPTTTVPSYQPQPQPPKPTNNGYHYHPEPAPAQPAQPTRPNNAYLTPVVEEKKAPVQTYHPQPTNQYLAPEPKAVASYAVHDEKKEDINKLSPEPSGLFALIPSKIPEFAGPIPDFLQGFPASNPTDFAQGFLGENPFSQGFSDSFQNLGVSGAFPQFSSTPDFTQLSDPSQIFQDAISNVNDAISGYVDQQPEAAREKESEPTQQVDDNGGYVY